MAKRRTATSRKLIAVQTTGWYLGNLKSVSDRFLGTAQELGRERLPKEQHCVFLQACGVLISDFARWYPEELFDLEELPQNWRKVRTIAMRCQAGLIDQFRRLADLTLQDDQAEYKLRYSVASEVLMPDAEALRTATLDI